MKKIEVFFFANRPLQRFNPLTKVYWKIRVGAAETNLRTLLLPCYLQLLGVDVGERDCGDESADDGVTMLFAAVGAAETNLRTLLLPCYLQLLGVDVGERDCGDESADDAVSMLFARG